MIPNRFETDRLVLRPIAMEDGPVIFESYGQDSVVSRYLTWRPHNSVADAEAYIAGCQNRPVDAGPTYAIVRRSDNRPIGAFDLTRDVSHQFGFGYVLAQSAWGNGFMTEALRHVATWALRQPDIYRFSSVCHIDNRASARVMAKAGLTQEGIIRRWGVFPNLGPCPRDCFLYARVR